MKSSLVSSLCLFESLKCLSFAPCMMPIYCRHHREIRFKTPDFFYWPPGKQVNVKHSSVNLKSLQIIKGDWIMVLFSEHPQIRWENSPGRSEVIYTGKSWVQHESQCVRQKHARCSKLGQMQKTELTSSVVFLHLQLSFCAPGFPLSKNGSGNRLLKHIAAFLIHFFDVL